MNKLHIELANCYGIKSLKADFVVLSVRNLSTRTQCPSCDL
jgi:hypothetical protein